MIYAYPRGYFINILTHTIQKVGVDLRISRLSQDMFMFAKGGGYVDSDLIRAMGGWLRKVRK